MYLFYSVIPGDARIFLMTGKGPSSRSGPQHTEDIRWHKLGCTDCVWMIPSTVNPED